MAGSISLICPVCNIQYERYIGHYNRAIQLNKKMYCSKECFSVGRKLDFDKHLKTPEQLKAEKATYDKEYREKNLERILAAKKKYYFDNHEKISKKLKAYRDKNMQRHVEYCRRPDQREKERVRNRKKCGLTEIKNCLCCGLDKEKIEFESYLIFPDGRNYLCKECEIKQVNDEGITTREVLGCIRTGLHKHQSILTIRDYTPYPYLIEAHKYSLLLKRLTR